MTKKTKKTGKKFNADVSEEKAAIPAETANDPVAAVLAEVEAPKSKKGSTKAEEMRDVARALMEEMLPGLAVLFQKTGQDRLSTSDVQRIKRLESRRKCRICKQTIGPGACVDGQTHAEVVIFPERYPHFAKHFQGVFLNGIRYISNNRRQRVSVPLNFESEAKRQVLDFERNEYEMMFDSSRTVEHDSGTTSNPVEANKSRPVSFRDGNEAEFR